MKLFLTIILLIISINSFGQIDTINAVREVEEEFYSMTLWDSTLLESIYSEKIISWGITCGANYNSKFLGEIGFGKANYGVTWHHWGLLNYYLGSEIGYWDNQMIFGPKVSFWINGGSSAMALGLNLINYTDFSSSSLKFRPEIGIGISKFKLVYGYNLSFFNESFANIGKHNVNLVFYFDIKKISHTTMTYRDVLNKRKEEKLKELNSNNEPNGK